jgi:hypothetical protein
MGAAKILEDLKSSTNYQQNDSSLQKHPKVSLDNALPILFELTTIFI